MLFGRARLCAGTVFVCAIALMCPAAASAAPHRVADGKIGDWLGTTSGYGGTSQYSHGEFIYQDYIFDDLGAETNSRSQQHGTFSPPSGDYRYPTDEKRYGYNAADLLELRLAADRDSLWILARMNTLKVPDSTVVAVAFDTDRRSTTGGGEWPFGAGLKVAGVDRVVTLWGTGGAITRLPSGATAPLRDVGVDTANDDNAIEARVPRGLLGGGPVLRVWAATGLWDPSTRQWMPVPSGDPTATHPGGGSATVPARAFNVAFRPNESGSYMEEGQAAALANGDISALHADVDLRLLLSGATRPFKVVPGRFYTVVMDQNLTIPPYNEGLSYSGIPGRFSGAGGVALSQHFDFYGRYQPYGLYVPSTYGRRSSIPAALVLHGLGGSYSTYNSQPGFIRDMGEGNGTPREPPMFLITPLARGSSFYADWGEADTLDVLTDVLRRFPIDRSRLYLTGYSMGGYGVYRFAALYPDLFAAAAVWAGYTGEFTGAYLTNPQELTGVSSAPSGVGNGRQGRANIGDAVDTLDNLRYLPLLHMGGTNDEIVPTTGQYAAPRRLAELGYRSGYSVYPGYEHLSFAIVDDWKEAREWLGNAPRTATPRTVTYKFSDGWTAPGLARKLGLVHGQAWWMSGLTMRKSTTDGLTLASATATSFAVPERAVTPVTSLVPVATPTPHVEKLVSWTYGRALPSSNRLDISLVDVGTMRIDLGAARLRPCGLVLDVRTDGVTTLRLRGDFSAANRVLAAPGTVVRMITDGLLVRLGAASTRLRVSC